MFKLLSFLFLIYNCHAFPASTPPELVCDSMTGLHDEFEPQTSPLPYDVAVDKSQVKGGETVEIFISGHMPFKGLFVQVRKGKEAVGEFILPGDEKDFRTINCHGHKNSGITHDNVQLKNNKKLIWKAPTEKGDYTVYVTILERYEKFWLAVPTAVITVV